RMWFLLACSSPARYCNPERGTMWAGVHIAQTIDRGRRESKQEAREVRRVNPLYFDQTLSLDQPGAPATGAKARRWRSGLIRHALSLAKAPAFRFFERLSGFEKALEAGKDCRPTAGDSLNQLRVGYIDLVDDGELDGLGLRFEF